MKIQTHIHEPAAGDIIGEILAFGQDCHTEQDVSYVLDKLVEKIAFIMQSDVASLYLLDSKTGEISLRATKGLNKSAVGQIKLKRGEGLVGKTIEWLKPVSIAKAKRSKRYKYFPESGEEKYTSFLAVPLIYNRHPIGVLVVQNEKITHYNNHTVHLLLTLAIPTVSVIEKTMLLGTLGQIHQGVSDAAGIGKDVVNVMHEGIPASHGIGMAPVKFLRRQNNVDVSLRANEPIHVDVEKMRVLEAFRWVEEEIKDVQKKASMRFGMEELSIFDAYSAILESQGFKDEVLDAVEKGQSALQAVAQVVGHYTDQLSRADNEYIKERAYDIQDVGRKITDCLLYGSNVPGAASHLTEDCLLLADFWSVSDLVELDLERVKGILCPVGGALSHVAILAQSLGIPAVLGLSSFTSQIREGDFVIMDGSSGWVVVRPDKETLEVYKKEAKTGQKDLKKYKKFLKTTVTAKGGRPIAIAANMGMVAHMHEAIENGADEVGLYRTEFPFLIRRSLPTEEEQAALYKKIVMGMGKKCVTIRTLDIGGDKYLPYLNLPNEENPSLGWRSIRISLDREDLFRIQLRALLRASAFGKMKLLFPMISSLEEIRKVKEILTDVKTELRSNGCAFDDKMPLGIMIEVPSAVIMAQSLIKEVQFFSIGTNDLIQYTLAVDRNNAKVAKLFDPFHPAVIRNIHHVVMVAHTAKKPVSICGEIGGNPMIVPLLVGMGVDMLSMNPPFIAKIKSLVSEIKFLEARHLLKNVLMQDSSVMIREAVQKFFETHALQEYLR